LVDPNAEATVLESGLTTSLVDTTVTFTGATDVNAHGVTLDVSQTSTLQYKWVKIKLNKQGILTTVIKNSSCTATTAYLYDTAGNLLQSTSFATDTATFNNTGLTNGNEYYVLVGSGAGTGYTNRIQTGATAYPYLDAGIDFVEGAEILPEVTDAHWFTLSGNFSNTDSSWFRFTTKVAGTLRKVNKVWTSTITRAILKDSAWSVLATANFIWNEATFNYALSDATVYRIEWDNNGSTYLRQVTWSAPWFPKVDTYIDWNGWSNNGSNVNLFGYNISSVTIGTNIEQNTNLNSIVSITTQEAISIPKWQRAHIVLFAGTYGSETVNATNYFGVGYTIQDTTTRPWQKFDGTVWSGVWYIPSTLSHWLSLSSASTSSVKRWIRITSPYTIKITNVTKNSNVSATVCYVQDLSGNILWQANYSSNVANLNTILPAWTYNVVHDNSWWSYNTRTNNSAVEPYVWTYISMIGTQTWWTGAMFDIESITTEATWYIYTTSTLFLPQLLSKTDATYAYKLPVDFPRIATATNSAWQECVTIWKWLADLFSGLTQDWDYYLANTAWAISATPWSNIYPIGQSINNTIISVWDFIDWSYALTNNTVYRSSVSWYVTATSSLSNTTGWILWTSDLIDWITTTVAQNSNSNTVTWTHNISFFVRKWYFFRVSTSNTLVFARFYPLQ
jgi:hypothetical protein